MANRFDTIFNREQYVPLVDPIPADMLYKMGKEMKDEQDAAMLESLKLKDYFKNIKTARFDVQEKAKLDPIISGKLEKVANAVANGDPNAQKLLYQTKYEIESMPEIQLLQHNYEQEKLRDKDAQDMEKAQTYRDYLDPYNQFAQERMTGQRGLQRYDFTGIKGHTPYLEDAKKSVANIATSTLLKDGEWFSKEIIDGKEQLLIRGSKEVRAVTPDMLWNVAQAATDHFLQGTKGGDSFKDEQLLSDLQNVPAGPNNPNYISYGGQSINPNDPRSLQTIEKALRDNTTKMLYDVGIPQLHISGGGNTIQTTPEHMTKEEETSAPNAMATPSTVVSEDIKKKYTIGGNTAATMAGYVVDKISRMVKGQPHIPYEAYEAMNGNGGDSDVNSETNQKLFNRAKKLYQYVDTSHWTDEDKIGEINRYVEDFSKQSIYYYKGLRTDDKTLGKEDDRMFKQGQFSDREFIDKETGDVVQGSEMGKIFQDATTKSNSVVWGPDNPYDLPSANEVTVVNKDGSVKKYIVKPVQGEVTPDQLILSDMYSVKKDPTGEKMIKLPVGGQYEDFRIVYEPTVKQGEYDAKDRYQVIGETVTLYDKNNNQVIEPITVPTGGDAIFTLYQSLLNNQAKKK